MASSLPNVDRYKCGRFDGVENLANYRPGGFCAIRIGLVLDNQYEIVAKLGSGGYSTVWLAQDRKYTRWVALKILSSEKSGKDNTELAMLQSFKESTIVQYLGSFWIQSPNGNHLCLVMEVTGPSVKQYIKPWRIGNQNPNMAIHLIRLCVTALNSLHSLGYAHGDVCSANFALALSDISNISKESMQSYIGDHTGGMVTSRNGSGLPPGMPEKLLCPVFLKDMVDISRVIIVDLGEAFSGCKEDVATHASYRAPELLTEQVATMQSDIWSLGCLICEIVTSHTLGILRMVPTAQAIFCAKSSGEQYHHLRTFLARYSMLKFKNENDMLAALLCEMLVQEPQKRISLEKVLEHEFFKLAGVCPDEEEVRGVGDADARVSVGSD